MAVENEYADEFASLLKAPIEASVSTSEGNEVILIRHAEAVPVADREPGEVLDPPLSKRGYEQAASTARALRTNRVVAVYSSDMKRCLETAEAVAAAHGLTVIPVPELREVEVLRKLPVGTIPTEVVSRNDWAAAGRRFVETGMWDAFSLSEGSAEFRRRVRVALDGAAGKHEDGVVCVVCHGGVINAYLAEILGIDRDYFFRPAHCSICRIGRVPGRSIVVTVNEMCHIDGRLRSS